MGGTRRAGVGSRLSRAAAVVPCVALAASACGRLDFESPGGIEGGPRSAQHATAIARQQADAHAALAPRDAGRTTAGAPQDGGQAGQILFGDLHVHTTYSWDGLLFALPLVGGEGTHPPADACDFARYCADLDFFALTDHAESLTADAWRQSRQSIRQCNEVAGDPASPDLVAFMGFEWSQAGLTPETHWGHRCVIFPEADDAALPPRPIAAEDRNDRYQRFADLMGRTRWLQPQHFGTYTSARDRFGALAAVPVCPPDTPVQELPSDCREIAPTPADLYAKLDHLGLEALAIPHGTTWGTYTPATADISKHLDAAQLDPRRQPLIEIMSGHGNSEEFRRFRERRFDAAGEPVCPEPTPDYLPCCWQAGEIMRRRCGDLPAEECERRVALARRYGARAWTRPQQVFPDASDAEWLDCGQCRDCFKPSYGYRPRESVQYAMALSRDDPTSRDDRPLRFRYGFVASSDNHTARPGTGYKQVERSAMTDAVGEPNLLVRAVGRLARRMDDPRMPQAPELESVGVANADLRTASFLYPGGLAAVHARGRDRRSIWNALIRREVYGTSGPRILLWFDLVTGDERQPMGSEVALDGNPVFEVRAVGDFVQRPGCPEWTAAGLSRERIRSLCHDECRNPGDTRHPIVAIEVVRIRPQVSPGEDVAVLIEDPWRSFACEPDPAGCEVRFADPDFLASGRDALYYVRVLQAETPAINGAPLETRFDAAGQAIATHVCLEADGCPAPVRERAWSSPIFVDQVRGGAGPPSAPESRAASLESREAAAAGPPYR